MDTDCKSRLYKNEHIVIMEMCNELSDMNSSDIQQRYNKYLTTTYQKNATQNHLRSHLEPQIFMLNFVKTTSKLNEISFTNAKNLLTCIDLHD